MLVFLFVLFCLSVLAVKGDETMNNNVSLTLEADKEQYSVGEKITLSYSFFNNTSESIYIVPWGGHYTTNWIVAYDKNGNKLPSLPLGVYELKFIPSKDDFICIPPSKSYSIQIEGKIINTELAKFKDEKREKYKGIFIDFNNSAIYLKEPDVFDIKAFYSGMEKWKEQGEKVCDLKNVWAGNLESRKIRIVIK